MTSKIELNRRLDISTFIEHKKNRYPKLIDLPSNELKIRTM